MDSLSRLIKIKTTTTMIKIKELNLPAHPDSHSQPTLDMMLHSTPKWFAHSDSPTTISVGIGTSREDLILHSYFKDNKPFILACDIYTLMGLPEDHQYDQTLQDSNLGNAATDTPWIAGLHSAKSKAYDLVLLNHPSISMSDWRPIYKQALKHLAPSGAIVTTTMDANYDPMDATKHKQLIESEFWKLETTFGIYEHEGLVHTISWIQPKQE